jgi:hypothetical protein
MISHWKLTTFTLITVCFAIGALCICFRTAVGTSSRQKENWAKQADPITQIDEKAARAVGHDEYLIKELSDSVVDWAVRGQLPPFLTEPYKERLARAEVNYRTGVVPGITGHNIVLLIDDLVQKLEAPDYARTDDDEVLNLRAILAAGVPHLVGNFSQANSKNAAAIGPEDKLSPIEAVFVTRQLIMQKEINEAYQTTPAERLEIKKSIEAVEGGGVVLSREERGWLRYTLLQQKGTEKAPAMSAEEIAAQIVKSRSAKGTLRGAYLIARVASPRTTEIGKAFRRAYSMKISDGLALTDSSLELLGIGK